MRLFEQILHSGNVDGGGFYPPGRWGRFPWFCYRFLSFWNSRARPMSIHNGTWTFVGIVDLSLFNILFSLILITLPFDYHRFLDHSNVRGYFKYSYSTFEPCLRLLLKPFCFLLIYVHVITNKPCQLCNFLFIISNSNVLLFQIKKSQLHLCLHIPREVFI